MNVFDFDNTIYDGESTLDMFFFYMARKPWLIKHIVTVLKAFARYKKGDVGIPEIIERYVPMVEKDVLRVVDFENDPRVFWDKHMKKIKPLDEELRSDDDLIITASPDFNIEEACRRLGIKRWLTSRVDSKTGRILFVNIRENKIKAFKEQYGSAEIENFYTDSPENDAPLIEMANHAFIVKKNEITQIK
ncbi:MAG: haloacid dehalogenase-like hydrolase [Eubacterium sp.]|nr:haloacid dehalogenase-like hydrolase [Eubacterium sp.]